MQEGHENRFRSRDAGGEGGAGPGVNPAGFVSVHEALEAEVTVLTARRPVSAERPAAGACVLDQAADLGIHGRAEAADSVETRGSYQISDKFEFNNI